MFLYIIQISPRLQKIQFPVNLRCMNFWKFISSFHTLHQKIWNLILGGVLREISKMQDFLSWHHASVFCALQVDLWPLWPTNGQLEWRLLRIIINFRSCVPSLGRTKLWTGKVFGGYFPIRWWRCETPSSMWCCISLWQFIFI